ncbi:hypothetical protein ACWC98_23070 [Streptomyces goshikiensis]
MSTWVPTRRPRRARDAASGEIQKLQSSVSALLPEAGISLRLRLALRIFDRSSRAATITNMVCGAVLGFWWPVPIAMILDDRPGSVPDLIHKVAKSYDAALAIEDPIDLITALVRTTFATVAVAAFYWAVTVGPLVLAYRVARGYAGVRFPGRKAVLLRQLSRLPVAATSALNACARTLGSTGVRRINLLHSVAEEIESVKHALRVLSRIEYGPQRGRRKRKKMVRRHVLRVSAAIGGVADRIETASDSEIRQLSAMLLSIAERSSERRYVELLDQKSIDGVVAPDREPVRLALGAALALVLASASVGLLNVLGISDGLEPLAIGASIIIAAVIVFRGRAVQKLESLGIFGGGSNMP